MALSLSTRPFTSSACTARAGRRASRVSRSVVCVKAQQKAEVSKISKDLETALLSAALSVAAPLAAHADEPVATAAEAAAGAGGFGAGEVALLVTPVVVYTAFSVYREKVNPRATFLDYVYIMVFLAIVANLVSIVAFKTRFF